MIDLPVVKLHLRVDHAEEDALIQGYIDAAVVHVEQHCDRQIVETPTLPEQMALTKDVEQAILMLVGHWYASREAVVIGSIASDIPLGFERLLWYRRRF